MSKTSRHSYFFGAPCITYVRPSARTTCALCATGLCIHSFTQFILS